MHEQIDRGTNQVARKKHDDGEEQASGQSAPDNKRSAGATAGADRDVSTGARPGDDTDEAALRPRTFDEFIGQRKVAEKLHVYVTAAKNRNEPLDHVLLSGPPGLGKTTLAHVIAHEMGTVARVTSGPSLERKSDLAGILTGLARGDVLFIDEIHRLPAAIEETLYPAMEDFKIEVVTGAGPGATAIELPIEPFTLVGATTRTGRLTSPLRDRFGIVERFDYYGPEDLATIVRRSARILDIPVEDEGAHEIGARARGTPRVANRLLRRVRDFAQVRGDGRVTLPTARYGLEQLEIDESGLDAHDRRYLAILIQRFAGGPVGVESLAAALSDDRDTLEYVIEPFLIQEGFIVRTQRGRQAARKAYEHLQIPATSNRKPDPQGSLF